MENKILATVENMEITQKDLNQLYQGLSPEHAAKFNNEAGMKQLIKELVHQEMLFLDAKEQHLEEESDFQEELNLLKKNLLKQYALKKLFDEIKISEEAMKTHYAQHQERFKKPAQIRASHILVNTQEKGEEIFAKLLEGEKFEDLATIHSLCPSKQKGGDLGFFSKGKMVPEFDKASFALSIDEISKPVKTQFGYHIIKKTDEEKERALSYEEVRESIEMELQAIRQNERYIEKTEALERKYNATYHVE